VFDKAKQLYSLQKKARAIQKDLKETEVEAKAADGEVMVGSTLLTYDPKRQGNFIIPADPQSNNIRVFVVSSAVKSVKQLFDHPE